MASRLKVAIVGATGETGQSIVEALLASPEQFEVFALTRLASTNKPILGDFSTRGATVKPVDYSSMDNLVAVLTGMHVVISTLTLLHQKEQLDIIEACSKAKVQRFVPSFFGPACPPRGVMGVRDAKEDLLDCIKRLYLPYTAIDIGWWYQLALPQLASGRIKTKAAYALNERIGDGEVPIALVDNREIGKLVARIIADVRTLNRSVFAYGEVWTQNRIIATLEEKSGEKIVLKTLSKEAMETTISDAYKTLETNPTDIAALTNIGLTEYKYSLGIRGDNTPEHAKYLGYLDFKELYPDAATSFNFTTFITDMLDGKIRAVYSGA